MILYHIKNSFCVKFLYVNFFLGGGMKDNDKYRCYWGLHFGEKFISSSFSAKNGMISNSKEVMSPVTTA